ncbi:DoxX family protein [Kibdelosporangium aridum]|uniref:DoxX family protein n=1 Tax=Kibdelosporangium aridum TaxID=2030 RepID=UPI0035E771B9
MNLAQANEQQRAQDVGLLLLRACLGLTMAGHGAQHLFGWFGGVGLTATGKSFSANGYPSADVMAVIAGVSELLGGLGLAFGLLTPLAAAAVIGTMINAAAVKWPGGYFLPKGMEYEFALAVSAAALALTGPGRIAVDRFLPLLRTHRLTYGIAAVALGVVSGAGVLLTRS